MSARATTTTTVEVFPRSIPYCSILTCLSGHTNSRTSRYKFDNMVGNGVAAPRGLQHPSIRQSTSGSPNLNLFLLFVAKLQNSAVTDGSLSGQYAMGTLQITRLTTVVASANAAGIRRESPASPTTEKRSEPMNPNV